MRYRSPTLIPESSYKMERKSNVEPKTFDGRVEVNINKRTNGILTQTKKREVRIFPFVFVNKMYV